MRTIEPHEFDPATPVLDVRKHRGNEQPRGALRYDPQKLLDAGKLVLPLPKEGAVALLSDNDELANAIGERLESQGYGEALVLRGGIDEWKARDLPTEEATQEQPIPGQEDAGIHLS